MPMTRSAMMEAAEAQGVMTQVGYNYIKNPLLALARDMIAAGELGEITGFRGIHAEDYMADPEVPYNWRVDPRGGGGAVADLGSHIVGMARFLLGPDHPASMADLETVVKSPPVAAGASRAPRRRGRRHRAPHRALCARLWRHDRGQLGGDRPQDAARLRASRHQGLARLHAGALQRAASLPGGRTIRATTATSASRRGPQHHPYGLFCVAPGHQLGFNDLKTIEVADFLDAIAGGRAEGPGFPRGLGNPEGHRHGDPLFPRAPLARYRVTSREDCLARDRADPLAGKRASFALPEGLIYLDGNSLGALPRSVAARVADTIDRQWGATLIKSWNEHGWFDLPRKIGDRIAKLIGAPPASVVACDTISVNLYKLLGAAVRLQPGRHIILSDTGNFPTDLYMMQGLIRLLDRDLELRLVEPEDVEAAITDDVAVVSLTEVDYRTGRRHDMKRLTAKAHEAGALAIWDLAHSAGAFPVDLSGCKVDFAVGCTYKYLNGGPGAPAFLYVRPDLQDHIQSPLSGWWGHEAPFAFDTDYRPASGHRPTAMRHAGDPRHGGAQFGTRCLGRCRSRRTAPQVGSAL